MEHALLVVKLLPLEPVDERVVLEAILLVVQHYYFIANAAELHGVADPQLEAKVLLEAMIGVCSHVAHDEPQFVARAGLLLLGVFDLVLVEDPEDVVLEEAGDYAFGLVEVGQRLLVLDHAFEISELF